MNVRLKTKVLKNNRLSYYLQYYDPGTGKRHKEYLGLYLVDKPRNEFDSFYYAKWKIKDYYRVYNTKRKHRSLNRKTPEQIWNTHKKITLNSQFLLN